jgi:transposase
VVVSFPMMNTTSTLSDDPQELKRIIAKLESSQQRYEHEIDLLREQIRLLYARIFGKKSEKGKIDPSSAQLPLFDMPEPEAAPEKETLDIPAHTREKSGRKKLPENLPRVEVVHDISEEEKVCVCGGEMSKIGEDVSEKLDIIPAVIRVIRHIRPKYACKHCEGIETEGPVVRIAPAPKQIVEKGIATAGLLAHILTAKFCDALPFYRQERQFTRLGVNLPRATMCNWAMKAALACEPLLAMLEKQIRSGPLINIDETTVQVLAEPGRAPTTKSYMWIFRGGPPEKPALVYQYHPSRSGDVAASFVKKYKGVVQTDGYAGYDFLDKQSDIHHIGCWAHARRKFMDADKGSGKGKKTGSADLAVSYIRKLYAVEHEGRKNEYGPEQMRTLRQKKSKPIIEDFYKWLGKKSLHVVPKSLLGIAVNYTLKQWPRLIKYLDHGEATPDNNAAENAIRPFVVGRKNWLFAGTPAGATASALLYSLIETAKANGLEPYKYLRYLFEKLPFAVSEDDYGRLLPQDLGAADLDLGQEATGV